jgi:hypothetical protein
MADGEEVVLQETLSNDVYSKEEYAAEVSDETFAKLSKALGALQDRREIHRQWSVGIDENLRSGRELIEGSPNWGGARPNKRQRVANVVADMNSFCSSIEAALEEM